MELKKLEHIQELEALQQQSFEETNKGVLIFKHSTRCGVSSWVWKNFQKDWNLDKSLPVYFLDLIKHRDVSNKIADDFEVQHQSPQILWIHRGKLQFHASHSSATVDNLLKSMNV